MANLRALAAGAIACILALAPEASRAAEPLTIKVGWVVLTSSSVPLSLEKKELLPHYGRSYVIEPQNVRSTSAMATALATSEVHVGTLAYSSLAFAIQNAQLNDLRIITDVIQDGVGNHATTKFMVLKDGPVKTVNDLRGKVIASLAVGTGVDIAIRAMLRKNGLDDRKDVTFVAAQFPNMKAMLLDRKADLISATLPYSLDPVLLDKASTLFTQKEAVGTTQMLVWVARDGFLKQHRAAMIDFLEDSLRFTRYITNPANHNDVVAFVAKAMKQPPERLAGWLFSERDQYRDRNGLPNLGALQANINLQHELGFLEKPFNVREFTELSLVQEAGKRLDK